MPPGGRDREGEEVMKWVEEGGKERMGSREKYGKEGNR